MKVLVGDITINAQYLKLRSHIRYWEDSYVDDVEDTEGDLIPCREDENWCPIIDIDTGKILNWEQGKTADIHYKVCDENEYQILDDQERIICNINGYVSDCLCPKDSGYGDYIIMDINKDGIIDKWNGQNIVDILSADEEYLKMVHRENSINDLTGE